MTPIRVVLADDHSVMREGLRTLIDMQPHMEVVGEADDGRSCVSLARKLQPDVVVLDISMPEVNGLKTTQALRRLRPGTKILVLTRHAEHSYVQALMQAGASGYVVKQSASEELVRAIQRVAAGQVYLDPAITKQAVSHLGRSAAAPGTPGEKSLSNREEEVLRLVAWGLLSKEIAARLDISIKTVETHKANAMRKMGMSGRVDIVRYALLQGWLGNV
jgi:DNA-binding NarL/FixJ family response regulator